MPTATTRNGFRKPDPGSDNNTWGSNLNSAMFDLIDSSLDGWTTISATTTLTSTQYVANQARMRLIKYTGTSTGTLTIPNVEKWYLVWASGADCIITNGGSSVTIAHGSIAIIVTDGTTVKIAENRVFNDDVTVNGEITLNNSQIHGVTTPTLSTDVANKSYVDSVAFAETDLPGITSGTSGQFVGNNGVTANWYWDGYQGRSTKSSNYPIVLTDRQKLIAATAALTFTLAAATTLTSYFTVRLANEAATAYVTVATTGADTINGSSTITLAPGDVVDITGDGTSSFIAKYVVQQPQGPHVIVQDQKPSNTSAGTASAAAYKTRTLNTIVRNTVGASLSSNKVTLPAGTWLIEAYAPAAAIQEHRVRIYNVTDSSVSIIGASDYESSGTTVAFASVKGVVTISTPKEFRVDHYTKTAGGLGTPASTGDVEIYTTFYATRISG